MPSRIAAPRRIVGGVEPDTEEQLVLRCTVDGLPEAWTWVVSGRGAASEVTRHDPRSGLRVEVLAGAVEVHLDGRARVYRTGESVIFPAGVARQLRASD